jgi:hypothetical protein
MTPPRGVNRTLWNQYVKRQGKSLTDADLPLIEMAARLHERLNQVTAALMAETANGTDFMADTVRGTTAHPLLGHERELIQQLRLTVAELTKRMGKSPAKESPTDQLERRLRAVS